MIIIIIMKKQLIRRMNKIIKLMQNNKRIKNKKIKISKKIGKHLKKALNN